MASGDSVRFSVPNSGWLAESGEKLTPRDPAIDTGHALVGPIAVRGAKAGQTLAVHVDEVRPGSWGITKTKPPHFIRWAIKGNTATSLGRTVQLAPFLGVLGMTPPEPGIHSTIPPRRFGGNIDCKDLVAGTTLYLPIAVDGALFSAGDGHAEQGGADRARGNARPDGARARPRPRRRPGARLCRRRSLRDADREQDAGRACRTRGRRFRLRRTAPMTHFASRCVAVVDVAPRL